MSGFFGSRHVVLVLPCITVLAGLYYLRSAWATILFYHAVIVIYLFLTRRNRARPALFRGWHTPTGIGLILLCACSGPLLVILWPVIENVQGSLSAALDSFGLHGARWWLFAAYFVSMHPILEEIFWRDALAERNRSIDIADVAFAVYHVLVLIHFLKIHWVVVVFVILVLVSSLWRCMAGRYHGLAMPMISHMTAGVGIMTALYLITRG